MSLWPFIQVCGGRGFTDLTQCLSLNIHSANPFWRNYMSKSEGYCEAALDLAWNILVIHRHSSLLMGVSRELGCAAAIAAPTVSGLLLSQVAFSSEGLSNARPHPFVG